MKLGIASAKYIHAKAIQYIHGNAKAMQCIRLCHELVKAPPTRDVAVYNLSSSAITTWCLLHCGRAH